MTKARNSDLEVDEHALPFRFELKIPLQDIQFATFMQSLYQLGLFPRTAFPDRTINSIYLDTPALKDYLDNVAGISTRSKTRLRWYGGDPTRLALEFKMRTNKASRKQVISLNNPAGIMPGTSAALRALAGLNKEGPSMNRLAGLIPTLKVTYDRQYYVLARDLRMTVDRRQRFTRLNPGQSRKAIRSLVDVVVEFKFPMQGAASFKKLLSGIPFRVFRHSKYVIGIDTSYG